MRDVSQHFAIHCAQSVGCTWVLGLESMKPFSPSIAGILRSLSEAVVVLDTEGRIRFANDVSAKRLGFQSGADIIGLTLPQAAKHFEVLGPDGNVVPPAQLLSYRVMRGQHLEQTEICYRLGKDGEVLWSIATPMELHDESGQFIGHVMQWRDITNEKKFAATLRETEERYRRLIEACPDAIVVHCDGRIVFTNAAAAVLLGADCADTLVGRAVLDFVPPESHALVRERMRAMTVDQTEVPLIEERFVRPDGTLVDVEVAGIPFTFGGKRAVQLVGRDVTERKRAERLLAETQERSLLRAQNELAQRAQAEAALQAEKERLVVTLRSIGDGVIATDTKSCVTMLNPVAEALVGWTQAEAVGRPVSEVFRILDQRTREPTPDPVARVLATGTVVELANHTVLVSREGAERIIADSGAPIRGLNGEVLGVVLVFRDITDKERLEAELMRASKLESLGLLAGGIAHDFNNILTGIIAYLSLATELLDRNHRVHPWLVEAEKAGLRARDLTYQLLTFAKGGAPIRRPTSLGHIIEDSARFAVTGSTSRVVFDIADELWPVHVDAGQISQVMQNLTLNAVQAMPDGGTITVRAANVHLEATPLLPAGRYVEVRVRDQGIGMSPDLLPHIFDPFFTTKAQGSGLGLATSFAVVRKHDGSIDVTSTPGVGTEFVVRLPATETRPDMALERAAQQRVTARVLVMDDDPIMRATARTVLMAFGYEVMLARDGADAVRMFAAARDEGVPFDLVVLDLTVPGGMGGREALQQLRAIDPKVRAIVASGYSEDPVMAHYAEHGFVGVMAKPYTAQQFDDVLQAVLASGGTEHPA